MVTKRIDRAMSNLFAAENNLQYIKALQALVRNLDLLFRLLNSDEELRSQYQDVYEHWFLCNQEYDFGVFDRYSRILLSMDDYNYGNKPF